jgi:hypothetical protein
MILTAFQREEIAAGPDALVNLNGRLWDAADRSLFAVDKIFPGAEILSKFGCENVQWQ